MDASKEQKTEVIQPVEMKRVTISIPSHIYDRVKSLANHEGMSQTAVMQFALNVGLTNMESQFLNLSKKSVDANQQAVDLLRQFVQMGEILK